MVSKLERVEGMRQAVERERALLTIILPEDVVRELAGRCLVIMQLSQFVLRCLQLRCSYCTIRRARLAHSLGKHRSATKDLSRAAGICSRPQAEGLREVRHQVFDPLPQLPS